MYRNPAVEKATDTAVELAAKSGLTGHAAALRWTIYHSILKPEFGDAVIIGASSNAQLTENLNIIEQGPLAKEVVDAFDGVYAHLGDSQPPYHF
jgi:aflatoxin B1 aldehyde reductase